MFWQPASYTCGRVEFKMEKTTDKENSADEITLSYTTDSFYTYSSPDRVFVRPFLHFKLDPTLRAAETCRM